MVRPAAVSPLGEAHRTHAVLAVSPTRFIVIWWVVQSLHAAFIVYSVFVIKLHRFLIVQGLQATIDYMGPTVFGFFDSVIIAHYVLIVCHASSMLQPIRWSMFYRQWLFIDRSTTHAYQNHQRRNAVVKEIIASTTGSSTRPTVGYTDQPAQAHPARTLFQRVSHALQQGALALFGRFGFFGVEGAHYETTYFAMEVVEIGFQTFQSYKLILLVPRVWINRFNAVVLILNCWSTVFVHQRLHSDRLTKRVVLLVVDGIFDTMSSMVIPLVIIYPYYAQFDFATGDFPLINYYYDKWFIQAISENRQVFVTSWLDFISKLTPGITVFGGMLVLKQYIVMDGTSDVVAVSNLISDRGNLTSGPVVVSIAPSTLVRVGPSLNHDIRGRPQRKIWQHAVLFVSGLAILVIHIHSTTVAVLSNTRGCLLEVRPWFATTYTCIALEINCLNGEYDDGANEVSLDRQAQTLRPSAIKSLIFSSCSRLHIPPVLQRFSAMQMLKIYNCTVAEWNTAAELRQDLHPDLQLLYISDSNFSNDGSLPAGLLSDKFPPCLADVEFSGTNLVRFPPNLHEKWTKLQYFVLERNAKITEIPEPLLKMKIPRLYLAGNGITMIPDGLLAGQAFWMLSLNGNPLPALPDTIGDLTSLFLVEAAHTNVSALPSWLTTVQYHPATGEPAIPFLRYATVSTGGSPLCEDTEKQAIAMNTKLPWVRLNCSVSGRDYTYPIDEEREWRAASLANMG